MQLNTDNQASFGRIGFANNATKEAFYKKLKDGRTFNGLTQEAGLMKQHFCRFALEKEANRHDRLLRIGMTKIKGNDVFLCQGAPLMLDKNGKQSFFSFVTGLFLMTNKKYRELMTKVVAEKGLV